MTVRSKRNIAYGLNDPLLAVAALPIVSVRAPTVQDFGELGQIWIHTTAQAIYMLAAIVNNAAVWTTSPASGVGIFAAVTVNPGDVDLTAGDVNIAAGDLNITAGNANIGGNVVIATDLTVNGVTTINGDFDLTSTALIDFTSTLNAAPSILLHANGGVAESIELHSDQGTSATSINIHSDVGGVTLAGGLATADAINLTAVAGGVDVDGALQINIDSSQAAATALRLVASNAAGGIDIDSGTAGIAIDSTGAVSLQGAAASDFSVGGAGIDLSLVSAAGRVVVNGEEAAADAVRILSVAGGLDANVALQMNLDSSQAAVDAVRIIASGVAGGIDIDSGTGGITIDSTGAISIDGAAASNITVTGAGLDLTLSSVGGSVAIASDEAVATAISLNASNAAGGIDIDYGTGGMDIAGVNGAFTLATGTGAISVSADAAATTMLIGTGAAVKNVTIGSTDTTSVTTIQAGTTGINLNAAGQLNAQVATDTVASPGTTATVDAALGKATFTGFTTAAAGTQVFTITNAIVTAASTILVSASNLGANDAQMTVTRVTPGAGTFDVTLTNNGAAALNGDVIISFWSPA